jgi:hypothetical protein
VVAKIADLDIKSIKGGKDEYWKTLEQKLIYEGWYGGTEWREIVDSQNEDTFCEL